MVVHVEPVVRSQQGIEQGLTNLQRIAGRIGRPRRVDCRRGVYQAQAKSRPARHGGYIEQVDREIAEQSTIYNQAGAAILVLLLNRQEEKRDAGATTHALGVIY